MTCKYVNLTIIFFVLIFVSNSVFASNHTYRVYNPKTNKTVNAVFGTMSISENRYLWGFYTKDGKPLCVAQIYNTNVKNGLVGGICTDAYAFKRFIGGEKLDLTKYGLSWRELSEDTIFSEMESIRSERALQGKFEYYGQ